MGRTREHASDVTADPRPDAWERFERAVDHAVKTPAMHRETKKARPANKGRIRKGKGRP